MHAEGSARFKFNFVYAHGRRPNHKCGCVGIMKTLVWSEGLYDGCATGPVAEGASAQARFNCVPQLE